MLKIGWFKDCVIRGLGNGVDVLFWKHHWIGNQPLCCVFPHLFTGCRDQNLTVAAAGFWEGDLWQWAFPDNFCNSQHQREELNLLLVILRDVAPVRDSVGSWKWILQSSKQYLVKSCYNYLMQRQQSCLSFGC